MSDIERIQELATAFREAIEKTSFSSYPMLHFPNGCCGDATIYLSEYLMENGFQAEYYCGLHPRREGMNPQRHAWVILEDGTIADITGDQFKNDSEHLNYDKPVYVGEVDDFHGLFATCQTRHIGGIDCYDEGNRTRLKAEYERIKGSLL